MKLKKLFAGIVAVAMMATMAIPGFAAKNAYAGQNYEGKDGVSIGDTKQAVTSVDLYKTYEVKSGTAPKGTFTFVIAADGDVEYGGDVQQAPAMNPMDLKVNYENDLTATDSSKFFTINMGDLNINHVGKYYYKITENRSDLPGVTGDDKPVTMIVSAVNNDAMDGGLLYYVALVKDGKKIKNTNAFKNTYDSKTLKVSKTVHGDFGDLNKTFAFDIELKGDGTGYAPVTISYEHNDNVVFPTGVTENPSSVVVNGDKVTVYLKHKGEATISNLPAGVTYTVTEAESDTMYSVALDRESTADLVGKEASGRIAESNIVNFHNTHNGVVDTGVILDNAPYIALLTIVAAGAVVMIMKKRRNYED